MAISIELATGLYAGRSVTLIDGDPIRIGSRFGCEFPVPDDSALAPDHFTATLTDAGVNIHGLAGRSMPVALVKPGDWLAAANSKFRINDLDVSLDKLETPIDYAIARLRAVPDLFAMIDTAQDEELRQRLEDGAYPAQPICDGFVQSEQVAGEPWLIPVTGNTPLIERLVRRAWCHSRLAFLQSTYSVDSLRKFWQAKSRDKSTRFFDARWLRLALRALPANEWNSWMGPTQAIWVEARFPNRLEHWHARQCQTIALTAAT